MQLDQTRIAIRERDFLDLLDLSLRLVRAYFVPWFLTTLCGAVPFALLNWWLLRGQRVGAWEESAVYAGRMLILVAWELPIAAAATTCYLGQANFVDRPPARRVIGDVVASLPQLIFFQVIVRGIVFLPALALGEFWFLWAGLCWWIPSTFWPFLNEVVLLERNPFTRRKGRVTTWKRSELLHGGYRGSLFGCWILSILLAALLAGGMSITFWYLRSLVTHHLDLHNPLLVSVCLPVAVWIVAGFFAVVRYLSYLDLRIRREGWEVELQLRAEAERLERQIG